MKLYVNSPATGTVLPIERDALRAFRVVRLLITVPAEATVALRNVTTSTTMGSVTTATQASVSIAAADQTVSVDDNLEIEITHTTDPGYVYVQLDLIREEEV